MTAIKLVEQLEKTFAFQGHSIERRRMDALALIRLYAPNQAMKEALKTAINTVECARIDPITKEDLLWYKQAKAALA